MKQELAGLTFEKMDLEKQLESGISGLGAGPAIQIQAGPGLNIKKNEEYMREKQMRELEEQRKQMLAGVDLIEQESLDAELYKRKGTCAYCCGKIWKNLSDSDLLMMEPTAVDASVLKLL